MSKRLSGILLAAGLLGLAALMFLQTFKVRNFPGTRFGAEIWSRAILICLGVLALVLLVQALRHRALTLRSSAIGIFVGVLPAAGVLAALLVHDVAPSPTFMSESPDIVYVILLAFVIG